jgi:hypothetical protein
VKRGHLALALLAQVRADLRKASDAAGGHHVRARCQEVADLARVGKSKSPPRYSVPASTIENGLPHGSRATYSTVLSARPENDTPSASNSSADQPMPTPRTSGPLKSTSSVAACLATSSGLCSGNSKMPVATLILWVVAAAKLRHTSGSSQSESAGTGIRPSAA